MTVFFRRFGRSLELVRTPVGRCPLQISHEASRRKLQCHYGQPQYGSLRVRLTEIVMWLTKQCYLRVSSRPWFYPVMWITAFVATILVLKVARPPHHGPSCSQQKVQVECLPIGTQFHGIPQNVPYEGGPEGSCWCGHHDEYCLCTPSLSVDVIIEVVALDLSLIHI